MLIFSKLYCECVDKTPTQLIEEAIKEIKAGKIPAERKEAEYFAK
jgi:DNA-directed RNA polymerase subunit K/omega